MEKQIIKAKKRTQSGKNENNRLRNSGLVPINIIGSGKSQPATVDEKEINKVISSGIRPATLLSLEMEGEVPSLVYVKEVQRFPASNKIRHVDFYRVIPGKKIKTTVAIQTTGVAKGSKSGGQFEHLIHEIKIKSSAEDLKDLIVVDVTELEIGNSIKVSQLPVPKSWEILVHGDPIVTSVNKTKAILAAERTEKVGDKDASKDAKGAAKPAAASAPAGTAAKAAPTATKAASAPAAKKK